MADSPSSSELEAFRLEIERLCQRSSDRFEERILDYVLNRRSVWVDGLGADSLARTALAVATVTKTTVLFVSPSESAWEDRRLKLSPRGPWRAISGQARQQTAVPHGVVAVTPETLKSPVLARALGPAGPALVVVEDAQALSGHSGSYRPSLKGVAQWLRRFPESTLICSSVASTPKIRSEVGAVLGRNDVADASQRLVRPFFADGASLRLEVRRDQQPNVGEQVAELPRPALVLCATPAQADQVYAELEGLKVPAHRFHAGLAPTDRAKELLHFALPGRRAVLVAVSAFGPNTGFEGSSKLGVPEDFGRDYFRRDIRSLVHLCAPCSLAQYKNELSLLAASTPSSRETSREDVEEFEPEGIEEPERGMATAVLYFDSAHLMLNHALLQRKRPSPEALHVLIEGLRGQGHNLAFARETFRQQTGFPPREFNETLKFLVDAGIVGEDADTLQVLVNAKELTQWSDELAQALTDLAEGDAPRLQAVEDYALANRCRTQTLCELLDMPSHTAPDHTVAGHTAAGHTAAGHTAAGHLAPKNSSSLDGSLQTACGVCDFCHPEALTASRGEDGARRVDEEHTRDAEYAREPRASVSSSKRQTRKSAARSSRSRSKPVETTPPADDSEKLLIPLRPLARAKARKAGT